MLYVLYMFVLIMENIKFKVAASQEDLVLE